MSWVVRKSRRTVDQLLTAAYAEQPDSVMIVGSGIVEIPCGSHSRCGLEICEIEYAGEEPEFLGLNRITERALFALQLSTVIRWRVGILPNNVRQGTVARATGTQIEYAKRRAAAQPAAGRQAGCVTIMAITIKHTQGECACRRP